MKRLLVGLVAATLVVVPLPASQAAAPSSCPGNHGTPTYVRTGTFSSSDEGKYVLVPFQVAAGSTRVRVKLCYDQPEAPTSAQIKHTLDLGMYDTVQADDFYDEEEFRGWGGSSRLNALVTPETSTTAGFKPGPIPPGEWAGEIGVAAVASQEEGDETGQVAWRMEIFVGTDPNDLDDPWQPTPYDDSEVRPALNWYKGDLHVHAEHSGPNDASMRETFDYAFEPRAGGGAGLDFITLSDYVTDRHWDEIGRFQPDYPDSLIMRSAEIITYRGHINNHDSHTYVDYRTGPIYELQPDGTMQLVRAAQPASRIFDDIHAAGGFTQVNHPTTFPATVPGFDNICRGCSWEYSDEETDWSKVDAFEIQTGPAGAPEPDGNEPGPNPFGPLAIEWWDRLNSQGYDITGVGVSDSHDAGNPDGPTESPIGEATTVVLADGLSEDSIHEAIDAGHAYVKFFHSGGPDLRLRASPAGSSKEFIMGDEVQALNVDFVARVLGAAPNPQVRSLVVMRDGQPVFAQPVTSDDFTFHFSSSTGGDYRLQLERGSATEALTNPINFIAANPPPPEDQPEDTTLEFSERSDKTGQFTDEALIEARLEDESGDPISGEPVDFQLTGQHGSKEWSDVTDDQGLALANVLLDLRPGNYVLTAQFAGDDDLNPSAASQPFRVKKEQTRTELRRDERHGRHFMLAHVTELDTPSHDLAGRPVEFFVDGESRGTRLTNENGIAKRWVPERAMDSGHVLKAKFLGGTHYKRSSDELAVP